MFERVDYVIKGLQGTYKHELQHVSDTKLGTEQTNSVY